MRSWVKSAPAAGVGGFVFTSTETRRAYDDLNVKMNEFLHRGVDIEDVVDPHLLALEKMRAIGIGLI